MSLSPDDKKRLLSLIAVDAPVPRALLEPLLRLDAGGEFLWPGTSASPSEEPLPRYRKVSASGRAGRRNLLFHGDNLPLLRALTGKGEGLPEAPPPRPRFIYLDPPFAVGADFYATHRGGRVPAFSDKWNSEADWLNMLYPRLALMREWLAEDGCLCLHCDRRTVAPARLLLDDCFGKDRFLNEIVWHYTGGGRSKKRFSHKHDSLLLYSRSATWTFNLEAVRVPYKQSSGYAASGITARSGKRYLPHPDGTPVDDVWDIPMITPLSPERLGYAVQKPERLLSRLILAVTNPDDTVADFFCGSGVTAAVAHKTGRRWLLCDQSSPAVDIAKERLSGLNAGFAVYAAEEEGMGALPAGFARRRT